MKIKKIAFLIIILITGLFIINVDAKSIGFGLGKTGNNQVPNIPDSYLKMFKENKTYYTGDLNSNKIYLTFDCGYENGNTIAILDSLKEANVEACFFITGHYLNTNEELVKRMIDEGHVVANHSNKHKDFTKISNDAIKKELEELEEMFFFFFNQHMPKLLRLLAGVFNQNVLEYTSNLGYVNLFWSVAYKDWEEDKVYGNLYAHNIIKDKVHNGAIILLHAVSKDNANDLAQIIKTLQNNYEFASVNDFIKI